MISDYVLREPMRAIRVQVICKDSTTFFCGRDCKRADTSKDICNNVSRLEELYKAIVFSVQPRIPVNFGKIEDKATVRLVLHEKTMLILLQFTPNNEELHAQQ